jgi:hypothetical protein
MIKFTKFDEFLSVVKNFTKEDLIKAKLNLQKYGLDITSLDELIIDDNGVLFTLLPDGTLKRVNLYIAEEIIGRWNTEFKPSYKYHIFKCSTIQNMFNGGRKHRYKINTRTDGTFYFRYIDQYGHIIKEVENEKIDICKNCLKKYFHLINKNYYPSKADIYIKEFNLEEFDKRFDLYFDLDDYKDLKAGDSNFRPNVYEKSWDLISKKMKELKNYTCEKCGFQARNNYEKKFIHTHHIDGDKTNNSPNNLKVLCVKCHANIDDFHSQLKSNPNYKEFLRRFSQKENKKRC